MGETVISATSPQRRSSDDESATDPVPSVPELDGWKLEGLDYTSFRISLVAKVMDRLTLRHMAKHTDLSIAEWRALSRTAPVAAGITVGQIAETAWVDRAEVSRAVKSLEKRGYIQRRDNRQDRRTPILSVTPKGHEIYLNLRQVRSEFHDLIMEGLTQEESDVFDTLLRKIADRLLKVASGDEW